MQFGDLLRRNRLALCQFAIQQFVVLPNVLTPNSKTAAKEKMQEISFFPHCRLMRPPL
jgi:hypothetical protein